MNIFLTPLKGHLSQGWTPPVKRDKRAKMAIYCAIRHKTAGLSQGRIPFVPGTGPNSSQGQVRLSQGCAPKTVPPKMFKFIDVFARGECYRGSVSRHGLLDTAYRPHRAPKQCPVVWRIV